MFQQFLCKKTKLPLIFSQSASNLGYANVYVSPMPSNCQDSKESWWSALLSESPEGMLLMLLGCVFVLIFQACFFFFRKGAWEFKKNEKKTTCLGWVTKFSNMCFFHQQFVILRAIPLGHLNLAFWSWPLIPGDVSDVFFFYSKMGFWRIYETIRGSWGANVVAGKTVLC